MVRLVFALFTFVEPATIKLATIPWDLYDASHSMRDLVIPYDGFGKAYSLAINDINSNQHLLPGHTLQLVNYPTSSLNHGDVTKAAVQAALGNAVGVVGVELSDIAKAAGEISAAIGLPLVSPSALSPELASNTYDN